MRSLVTTCILTLSVLAIGCSSSKNTSEAGDMAGTAAMAGAWKLDDNSTGSIHFMAGGEVMLEQGSIMTAINRFQNTSRAKYNTRLSDQATYSYDMDTNQLTLNVMADWTGKGVGSRKAADQSVASTIVFAIDAMEGNMMKLRKVSMSQAGTDTDNTNADENLMLTLVKGN